VIFGVRDSSGKPYFGNASFLGKTGLKYVNSDKFFEKQLKDNNIDAGDLQRIEKEDPALWDKIQGAKPDSLRNIAKGKLNMLKGFFESGRIGMLIDGTGGRYEKMVRQKETAEALGYDTMLLFVDTSEEIAVERNANRERKLPEKKVRELWSDVQNNKDAFQNLFGDKMVVVNNDKFGPPPEDVVKELNKFVDAPVENTIGRVWIEDELEMRGVQTLEPGGASGFRGSTQAADRIQQMRDQRGKTD
jgi:predicted kinase